MLLVADMSTDSTLDDIDAVFEIFCARHVRFVREKEPENRDSVFCKVIANKMDAPDSGSRLELLRQMLGDRLEIFPLSSMGGENVSKFPGMLFNWLKIVRVYTKAPGEKARKEYPHTVFAGQSVSDICELVHKDFFEKLRFARLWRGSDASIRSKSGLQRMCPCRIKRDRIRASIDGDTGFPVSHGAYR